MKYVIDRHKQEKDGVGAMSMNQLNAFYDQNNAIPESDHKAFIVMFDRSKSGEIENKWFRYFVSTKRLLNNCAEADNLQADGTYKLLIQNYPIVEGKTDIMRHFHLVGIALTTSEKTDG